MKAYKQGFYNPKNPNKYKGTHPIIFRSSYEFKFFNWCDNNSNVVAWGSESLQIPYIKPTDGRVHRYFVDNILVLKDANNNMHKYLVEIKPLKQTQPPKASPRKKPSTFLMEQYTYAVNMAKWEAATQWCDKNGFKFKIITEIDLGIK